MQIERRVEGGVLILSLQGRFVRGVGDVVFRETFDEILEGDHRQILLDLSEVPFIDSSAIGELVAAKRTAEEREIALKLVRLEDRVARTLRLGMILPLFETFSSEEEALQSFADVAD